MSIIRSRCLWIIVLLVLLISFFPLPSKVYSHDIYTGFSKWYLHENKIEAELSFSPAMIMYLWDIDATNAEDLRKITYSHIQPYMDKKLSVWLDGKKYPFTIKDAQIDPAGQVLLSCSVDGLDKDSIVSHVKIEYRLFFEETDNYYQELAYITFPPDEDDLVDFVFSWQSPVWEGAVGGKPSVLENMAIFLLLGVEHILTGYDHILFLLALVITGLSFRETIHVITAFTVAHSITLFLAAMKMVSLSPRLVEPVIALSICYVALENIVFKRSNYRWAVAFGFGLIHGFGFAGILEEIVSTREGLVYSVLSFNMGVEVGQIMIFLIVLPALHFLRKRCDFRKFTVGASALVFLMGLMWMVERVFEVKIL